MTGCNFEEAIQVAQSMRKAGDQPLLESSIYIEFMDKIPRLSIISSPSIFQIRKLSLQNS